MNHEIHKMISIAEEVQGKDLYNRFNEVVKKYNLSQIQIRHLGYEMIGEITAYVSESCIRKGIEERKQMPS